MGTLSFDALTEVVVIRDLLRRWWGLDLGLAAGDGSGYQRVSHATCTTVRGATGNACAAMMREIAAGFAKQRTPGAVVRECHAGMLVIAAPVFGATGLAGVVYASGAAPAPIESPGSAGVRRDAERRGESIESPGSAGARSDAERRGESIEERLVTAIKCSADEARELATAVPMLTDGDRQRVSDLVAAAATAVERAQPAVVAPTTWAHPFSEIVGDAPAVRDVVKLLVKVVRSEATVLVHGESGTGKELIARAIHYHGPRGKKPFVVQNCSAFNDNLLESALFGHVRGAFTGAVKDQKGLFEVADGGTFFLDEIGDMSAALQVKLLRVLQEGTFMPVGGTKPVRVDVRIIAASHKDLASMVAHKQFREDLFYRVNVLKITVPPLRERVSDIPRLAQHFVAKHWRAAGPAPRLSQGALAKLVAYPWPGNIRELENEIERMLVLAGDTTELAGTMVSTRVASAVPYSGGSSPRTLREVIETTEADTIVQALGRHSGDRDAAAGDLGVSRSYLEARLSALGVDTKVAAAGAGGRE